MSDLLVKEYETVALALGKAVLQWNLVEMGILKVLNNLMRADDIATGAIWVAIQSISNKLDLVDQYANQRLSKADASLIAELVRYTKVMAGERNFIAHNPLTFSILHDGAAALVVAGPKFLRRINLLRKTYVVKADELDELADDFSHVYELWKQAHTGLSQASLQTHLASVPYRRPLRAYRTYHPPKAIS